MFADEIEISPATEEKRKVGRIDRSRKNLTQRRWRARRKAEESELEEQVAELTQQVAELEIYNSSLEARHKCLHRQSELIELLHSQVPTGDNEVSEVDLFSNTNTATLVACKWLLVTGIVENTKYTLHYSAWGSNLELGILNIGWL